MTACDRTPPAEMPCGHCGASCDTSNVPQPITVWCGKECRDAYYAARPDEAKGWIAVEDLDADGRAELDSILAGRRGLRSVQ